MALQEPAVLSAALAVAASHHSRWRGIPDNVSRKYLSSAARSLRDRFANSNLVSSPVTLASMLLFVTYEVRSASLDFLATQLSPVLIQTYRYSRVPRTGKATMMRFEAGLEHKKTAQTLIPFSRHGYVLSTPSLP